MIVKAKEEYKNLEDSKNFIGLGKASTHLKLLAGMECEVSKSLLPLPKNLLKVLETKKIKSEEK
tara:strand:+ start:746 stop:937 length:192 start_codon:yes stop_codon:yes gene_type:complete